VYVGCEQWKTRFRSPSRCCVVSRQHGLCLSTAPCATSALATPLLVHKFVRRDPT
jgi:hypothetical protein